MKVACPRATPQVTSIGHVPAVVFPPMVQVQVTAPAASDLLAVRPCALLAPLLPALAFPFAEPVMRWPPPGAPQLGSQE
jgi:hypothetical protein